MFASRHTTRNGPRRDHLRACLPGELLGRIEHFGSTAVPGLDAKPIVDMLVKVADLQAAQTRIVPVLEAQGYDYFWRPTISVGDGLPFYAWFIKRASNGARTHHIHMVEPRFAHWDRLLFRDYLIAHPEVAQVFAPETQSSLRLSERPGGLHRWQDGVHLRHNGACRQTLTECFPCKRGASAGRISNVRAAAGGMVRHPAARVVWNVKEPTETGDRKTEGGKVYGTRPEPADGWA
jgi:GrpB-like predicted nucleotidyltransferase (UPF0157 family)